MYAQQGTQGSTLNEWVSFLSVLNRKDRESTLIQADADPYRMIGRLEQRFPVTRKYRTGKQLKLFSN